MENRYGLIVEAVTAATGTAERDAALTVLGDLPSGNGSSSAARPRDVGTDAKTGSS